MKAVNLLINVDFSDHYFKVVALMMIDELLL